MKKTLVTGVTGSGGSYLAEHLVDEGLEVHGISRLHSTAHCKNLKKIENKVTIHHVDLCDFGSLFRCLSKLKPDYIFHIASMANVRDSFENPITIVNNNVNITLNLLETVRILKEKENYNPRIQICSTSEVYGEVDPENIPIKETCPLNPASPYAVSKLSQDKLSQVYYWSYDLDIIRTRMFSYFNARRGDLFSTSFARQIMDIKRGYKNILKHGNLNSERVLIDVRDAVSAYWVAMKKCKSGEAYNIGGENSTSVSDILDILIKKSGIVIKCEQDPLLIRPKDITLQIPDSSKFKDETGWSPKYSLDESLDFFLEEVELFYE